MVICQNRRTFLKTGAIAFGGFAIGSIMNRSPFEQIGPLWSNKTFSGPFQPTEDSLKQFTRTGSAMLNQVYGRFGDQTVYGCNAIGTSVMTGEIAKSVGLKSGSFIQADR